LILFKEIKNAVFKKMYFKGRDFRRLNTKTREYAIVDGLDYRYPLLSLRISVTQQKGTVDGLDY